MKKILISIAMLFMVSNSFASDQIKIIVPFAAGGPFDVIARQVQKILATESKTDVPIEYKLGAGGNIGTEYVRDYKGKDTVIIVHSSAIVTNSTRKNATYDLSELKPVAYLGGVPMALVVNKSSNITTFSQFKSVQTPLFFGSGGVGTGTHIAGELLKLQTKQNLVHAPYKGEAPAMTDLVGGNINFMITGLTNATKFPEKLNILAVTGKQRNAEIPFVPTFLEQGVAVFDDHVQYALIYTNKSANDEQVKLIQRALAKAIADPAQRKSLVEAGLLPDATRLTNFSEFVNNKQAQARMVWSKINVE